MTTSLTHQPLEGKGQKTVKNLVNNTRAASESKPTLLGVNIGHSGTKVAALKGWDVKSFSFPTAVLQVPSIENYDRVFEYDDKFFVCANEADRDENAQRLVTDLNSVMDGRKVKEFDLYFRALMVRVTSLDKSSELRRYKIALSTSAREESYEEIKAIARRVKRIAINGFTYRYSIEVSGIYPESYGVSSSRNTKAMSGCDFNKAYLLDLGEGTIILSKFDTEESGIASGSDKGFIMRRKLGEGCAKVISTWGDWAAKYNNGITPNPVVLRRALESKRIQGGYNFACEKTQNDGYNKALQDVLDIRWEAISQLPLIARALKDQENFGFKIYACGGGALLFRDNLHRTGIEIIPKPRTADTIGLVNKLKAEGAK